MNPKQVSILAVLVAISGAIYFMVNQKRESSISKEETIKIGDRAVENFSVADVTKVTIKKPAQQVTLSKEGEGWKVAEREGYKADDTKIRGLLYTIKDMKIAESRSMRGESAIKALTLLHPDDAGQGGAGAGTVVDINVGDKTRSIIFGADYNSAGRSGRFVKTGGGVYVVSTGLRNLETMASAWLDKEFFKVQKSEKIAVQHEKPEDSYTLVRESQGSPLALEGASEDEEVDSAKLGSLKNILASANFNDYVIGEDAKPEKTGLDKPVTATIDTFEGFTYVVKIGNKTDDSKYHLSYQVSAEIPDAPAELPELTEEERTDLSEEEINTRQDAIQENKTKIADHKRLSEKLAQEQKFVDKAYRVDSWLVEAILKKRSELLKTEEDKKKEAEEKAKAAAAPGGAAPNIISEGPGGQKRITATTPPISIDPKVLEAERKKQEKAVIENQKKNQDKAAIKRMLEDHQRDKNAEAAKAAEEAKEEGAEAAKEEGTDAKKEEPAEADKPAEEEPAGEEE